MARLSEDQYFTHIAMVVSKRSTCPRANVGCVIVKDGIAIATGYNGSPHGQKHCTDIGCVILNKHCVATIHSEVNALLHATMSVRGATMYCTHLACMDCCKLIVNSRVAKLVYVNEYRDDRCANYDVANQVDYLRYAGVVVNRIDIVE